MRIISWNVNSLRSRIFDSNLASKKKKKTCSTIKSTSPLGKLIKKVKPDIICFQETKCIDGKCVSSDYTTYWNCAKKAGYSGVSIWLDPKIKPLKVFRNLPGLAKESKSLLDEGRILTVILKNFVIVNTYAPNTLRAGSKPTEKNIYIKNRINWDRALKKYLISLKKKYKNVILCGDLNVARNEMDLYRGVMSQCKLANAIDTNKPKSRITALTKRVKDGIYVTKNGGGAGYRLTERKEFEKLLQSGFVDVWRYKHPNKYGFTYWNMVQKAFRKANNGMRLDYFVVSKNFIKKVTKIKIFKELGQVGGKVASDHAAIALWIK